MEHTDNEKKMNKKSETAQIIFAIALIFLIATLLLATIKLSKNIDLIKSDPIEYGIKNSDLSYCYCYNLEGQQINYPLQEEVEVIESGSS